MKRSRRKKPIFLFVFFMTLAVGVGFLLGVLTAGGGIFLFENFDSQARTNITDETELKERQTVISRDPSALEIGTGKVYGEDDEQNTQEEEMEESGENETNPQAANLKSGTSLQTKANLNLRDGASLEAEVLQTIPAGEKVVYLSSIGSWYEVEYDGCTGYVSSEYLTEPGQYFYEPEEEFTEPTYINGVLVVNKEYGLPRDYAPGENKEAREAFNRMAADARSEGIGLNAFSTYRSYDYQKQLYESYVARDGKEAADRYSARPGHSEHQTGLAFDICQEGMYGNDCFKESDATRWLAEHAHEYGFLLRYPEGKEHITGYKYEPWHFRYLGEELAVKVHESGLTLEEYLGID